MSLLALSSGNMVYAVDNSTLPNESQSINLLYRPSSTVKSGCFNTHLFHPRQCFDTHVFMTKNNAFGSNLLGSVGSAFKHRFVGPTFYNR